MKFTASTLSAFAVAALSLPGAVATPVKNIVAPRQDGQLRVMPLGASITAGDYSLDEGKNGYREFVRDALVGAGYEVDMVGSIQSGSMDDNDHEGVSGDRIDQVASRAASSVPANQPNVILINAGTNDAGQDFEVDSAGQRMRDMIDSILGEVPDALVVLSTLLPSGNSDTQSRVDDINEQFRAVQSGLGGNVVLADMAMNIGLEHIHDGTHPDIEGEQMMSNLWVSAIQSALG